MDVGHFYYINDLYFEDFQDDYLMKNKETVCDEIHDRPCFFAFMDSATCLYWMIPFSSKTQKYRKVRDQKIRKYGFCDTIIFGNVLGSEKAFLIQNMCPVIDRYIKNEYIDSRSGIPVRISNSLEKKIIEKAKKVLRIHRNGHKLIFPDVLAIESKLKSDG